MDVDPDDVFRDEEDDPENDLYQVLFPNSVLSMLLLVPVVLFVSS